MSESAMKKAHVGDTQPRVLAVDQFEFRFFAVADGSSVGESGGSYAEQAGLRAVMIANEAKKLSDTLRKMGEKSDSDKARTAKLCAELQALTAEFACDKAALEALKGESAADQVRLQELAAEVEALKAECSMERRRNLEISGELEALKAESASDKAALEKEEQVRAAECEAAAEKAMEKLRADAEMARADAERASAKVVELKERLEELRHELRGWEKHAMQGGKGCQTQARLAEALVEIQTLKEALAKKEASLGVAEEAGSSLSTTVSEMFGQIQAMSEALRKKEASLLLAEEAVTKMSETLMCRGYQPQTQLPQLTEALLEIQTLMEIVCDKDAAIGLAKAAVREAFSKAEKLSEERDGFLKEATKLAELNKVLREQLEQWDGPLQTQALRAQYSEAEKVIVRQSEQIQELGIWLKNVKKLCYDVKKTCIYQSILEAFTANANEYKKKALQAVKATLDEEGLEMSEANGVYVIAVDHMSDACGYMHATNGLHKQRFFEMADNVEKTMALNVQLLERSALFDAEVQAVLRENDRLTVKWEESEDTNSELNTQVRALEARNRELVKSLKNAEGNTNVTDGKLQKCVTTLRRDVAELKRLIATEKERCKEWKVKCTQQKEEVDKAKKAVRSAEKDSKDMAAKLEALQKQPNHALEAALEKADTRVRELSAELKKAQCANDSRARLEDRIRLMGEKVRDAEKREEIHKEERQALQRKIVALKEETAPPSPAAVGLLGPAAFGKQCEPGAVCDEAPPGQHQGEVETLRDEVRMLQQQRELDAERIGGLENGILVAQTNERQANDIVAELLYAGGK